MSISGQLGFSGEWVKKTDGALLCKLMGINTYIMNAPLPMLASQEVFRKFFWIVTHLRLSLKKILSVGSFGIFGFSARIAVLFRRVLHFPLTWSLSNQKGLEVFLQIRLTLLQPLSLLRFFRSFILFLSSALHCQDPHQQIEKSIDYLMGNISSFSDEHLDPIYEIVKAKLDFFDGSREVLLPCPGISLRSLYAVKRNTGRF